MNQNTIHYLETHYSSEIAHYTIHITLTLQPTMFDHLIAHLQKTKQTSH